MTKMKYNGVHAKALAKAHDVRRRDGERTRDAVASVLELSDQPLVAREVQVLLARRGLVLEASYVKDVLDRLVADGRASARPETKREQAIRKAADGRGNHFQATYFWAPRGRVPARTVATVVQTGGVSTRGAKKSLKKSSRPAKATKVQTGKVAKVDTVALLVQRVAELEMQLAEIRKIAR